MRDRQHNKDANEDLPALCRECDARHKGICGVLNGAELRTLNQYSSQKSYDKGATLVASGETTEHYANILSGIVKLTKTLHDGRQQIVGLQFAPDFLGRAKAEAEASPVDVETASDVRLCRFPKAVIDRMVKDVPELQGRMFEQVQSQLDEAREWILTLGRKTATEKVASFLILISLHCDPLREESEQLQQIELPLSRADIADFLGLTLETVSRQMTRLRQLGAISIEHSRTITILNKDQLFELSGGN